MNSTRRGVIDIGTNSVKLLVADVEGREVKPVFEGSKQTRLGEGLFDTHRLQAQPMDRTAKAVAGFVERAKELKAESVRVIATSAAREATNAEELVGVIEGASGLKVEIISGEQEADWAFLGVTTCLGMDKEPLCLLEVGGGSTQVILGQGDQKHFRTSLRLGVVRLMQKSPHSDPPKAEELENCRQYLKPLLHNEVRPKLQPALEQEVKEHPNHEAVKLVGVGGTASILARMEAGLDTYEREVMERTRLSLERMRWHVERLWSLPMEERRQIVGLPANRADVILNGSLIYLAFMEEFGFQELRISTRGLRFGALMK